MVLRILRLAGPQTTLELFEHTRRYLPALSQFGLERMLTRMRRAAAVQGIDACRRQRLVFWALPGQLRPADAERRVQQRAVTVERRGLPRAETGQLAWWVGLPRDAFSAGWRQRFRP